MNTEALEKYISEHVDLIAVDAKGLAAAKDRAGKFLTATAILTSCLKELEVDMTKTKTLQEAQYATGIANADGKTITEKKVQVAHDADFTAARESHETLEAKRTWLKGYIKIFENAHLMYRQYSRE